MKSQQNSIELVTRLDQNFQQQVPQSYQQANAPGIQGGLNPGMSTTAIMRNFLPPNTCFETAFMNERPTTRIVAQKGLDSLHLLQNQMANLAIPHGEC